MVNHKYLSLALCIVLIGSAIFPVEVLAGGLRYKKLVIGYLLAKALKPRFVPVPIPLPFPLKLNKNTHVKYPVHSHSHSAHAQYVPDHHGYGGGYGGGFEGGYGGGFEGGYGGGFDGGYGGGHDIY